MTSEPTIAKLAKAIDFLGRFSAFSPNMQVSTVMTLLEIARADLTGQSISTQDIERRVGLLSGTASRNIYYWEKGHKEMSGGHDFVSVGFGADRRRRSLELTPKGRAFVLASTEPL